MDVFLQVKVQKATEGEPEILLVKDFSKLELKVGRNSDNDISIPDNSVSGLHIKIKAKREKSGEYGLFIIDCNSSNGTLLNGVKLLPKVETPLREGDFVSIVNYSITVKLLKNKKPKVNVSFKSSYLDEKTRMLMIEAHEQIVSRLELRKKRIETLEDKDFERKARSIVELVIKDLNPEFLTKTVINDCLKEAIAYGPITELLKDPSCSSIYVNNVDTIYAEIGGRNQPINKCFSGEDALILAIERLIMETGVSFDIDNPIIDLRREDSTKISAALSTVSLGGTTLYVRKQVKKSISIKELCDNNTITSNIADFLELIVKERLNIIVSGAIDTGKTTLLNALCSFIPKKQRVITIEEASELDLKLKNSVSLEVKLPDKRGLNGVDINSLIKIALSMRPDRVIVGDLKKSAFMDVLEIMNAGHDGSMITMVANSATDMIKKLENMLLSLDGNLLASSAREQISGAFDIVIQVSKLDDGSRKVSSISEIGEVIDGEVVLNEIFKYDKSSGNFLLNDTFSSPSLEV